MSNSLLEEMLSNSNFSFNDRPTNDKSISILDGSSNINHNKTKQDVHQAVGMLRAKKTASFDDFISMTSKLICLTMDDLEYEVEFMPQDNMDRIIDPDVKTDKVFITYNLISRIPLREIKPMPREEIIEKCDVSGEERMGMIFGQRYDCEVQFNIFASEYTIANEVMKMFEDMLFSFTGYMKENGIANILFKEQFTDTDYNIYRKSMSVRNLRYTIETENLIVVFNDKVEKIITSGSL